jgi:hypothetical protein
MAARYKIIFEGFDKKAFTYFVSTGSNDRKALRLATAMHVRQHPAALIERVHSFEHLEGTEPQSTDIADG